MDTPISVFSPELEPLGVLEEVTALSLRLRFFAPGDFSLELPATPRARALLCIENVLAFGPGGAHACVIEAVEHRLGALGTTLRVSGCTLGGLLRRRLAVPPDDPALLGWDVAEGSAGAILAHYVQAHAIAPAQPQRALPRLSLMPGIEAVGIETVEKARFQPLDEVLEGVAQYAGIGWRIAIVGEGYQFQALPAVDRTEGGDAPLLLSTALGNIASAEAGSDFSEVANAVYALGEGAYENRLYQVYYPEDQLVTGWQRREQAVDCGNEPSLARLRALAAQRLADRARTDWLIVRLIPGRAAVSLGDIVTVDLPEIGARYDLLITELRSSVRGAQRQLEATLGRPPRTLTGRLEAARRLRNVM